VSPPLDKLRAKESIGTSLMDDLNGSSFDGAMGQQLVVDEEILSMGSRARLRIGIADLIFFGGGGASMPCSA